MEGIPAAKKLLLHQTDYGGILVLYRMEQRRELIKTTIGGKGLKNF